MYHRSSMLLGLLAAAVISVACGPTDSSLTAKVKTNLATDETVKTASIDVAVQKKVVTLSGTVDTPAVKEKAVAVARQTCFPGSGPRRGPRHDAERNGDGR